MDGGVADDLRPCGRSRRQYLIDHHDHAVGLLQVGDGDVGDIAVVVDDRPAVGVPADGDRVAFDGLQRSAATARCDRLGQILRGQTPRHDVVAEIACQRGLVAGLEQAVVRVRGQGSKRLVPRREQGIGTNARERVSQFRGLHRGGQGSEVLRTVDVLHNVLRWRHAGFAVRHGLRRGGGLRRAGLAGHHHRRHGQCQ